MATYCTKCGAAVEDGLAFCTKCGAPVGGSGAPGPVAPAPPRGGTLSKISTATLIIIIVVAVLAAGGVGVAIYFLTVGAAGDCVYILDDRISRFPNYSEAECEQYCAEVRFATCRFEPYVALPSL